MQQTINQAEKVANMHPRKALVFVLCVAVGVLSSVVIYLFDLRNSDNKDCDKEKKEITYYYTRKQDSIRIEYIVKLEAKNRELEAVISKANEKLNTK